MALIRDRKGRGAGGYSRLFGNEELGEIISKAHAAVISAGTELERMIRERVGEIEYLDEFLGKGSIPDGVFLASKKQIKGSRILNFSGSEPDFVIFCRQGDRRVCHLVELKDGDAFDTKKAAAEKDAMQQFIAENARHLPYVVTPHFCCFNQDSRAEIVKGFKNRIEEKEAMTGREFCELLGIDYAEIIDLRKKDQMENLSYFVKQLVKIPIVRELMNKFRWAPDD